MRSCPVANPTVAPDSAHRQHAQCATPAAGDRTWRGAALTSASAMGTALLPRVAVLPSADRACGRSRAGAVEQLPRRAGTSSELIVRGKDGLTAPRHRGDNARGRPGALA